MYLLQTRRKIEVKIVVGATTHVKRTTHELRKRTKTLAEW